MRPKLSLLFFCMALTVVAQRPSVTSRSIVNAASYSPESGIAPGSIISLFGTNLASGTRQAQTPSLPRVLEGTSVTIDGVPAPLFYVSPTQINLQVPQELITEGKPPRSVPLVVTASTGTAETVMVSLVSDHAGVFTQEAKGCGQGSILNVEPDGNVRANTRLQSASPGSFISIYATGLGNVYFPPPDGEPAKADQLSRLPASASVQLGLLGYQQPLLNATYAGRAPGLVGVDQVNVQIPEDAPEGCSLPLTLLGATQSSQPVTISIRRGGGQCQDPPPARIARIHWQRSVSTSANSPSGVSKETLSASFLQAPEGQIQRATAGPEQGCRCFGDARRSSAGSCPGTTPSTLDIGPLALFGLPQEPSTVSATTDTSSTNTTYTAQLPLGSLENRRVRVSAAGSAAVGAFDTALSIPTPVQVTTRLSPGSVISSRQPFELTWTGGDASSVVRMRLISAATPFSSEVSCECAALASEGRLSLGLLTGPTRFPLPATENAQVIVTMEPRGTNLQTFAAPGLTLGGLHDWTFEYRFADLKIQ